MQYTLSELIIGGGGDGLSAAKEITTKELRSLTTRLVMGALDQAAPVLSNVSGLGFAALEMIHTREALEYVLPDSLLDFYHSQDWLPVLNKSAEAWKDCLLYLKDEAVRKASQYSQRVYSASQKLAAPVIDLTQLILGNKPLADSS